MEVIGTIIEVLPETSGESKAGKPWKKREYVIEVQDGQYPRHIMFDFFGERADQYQLRLGQRIKLSFDINSRKYNDRWYTNISGWRAEEVTDNGAPAPAAQYGAPAAPAAAPYAAPAMPEDIALGDSQEDDLPF